MKTKLTLLILVFALFHVAFAQNPPAKKPTIDELKMALESSTVDSVTGRILHQLTDVYYEMRDYSSALKYAQRAMDLYQKMKYTEGIADGYIQLGYCYAGLKKRKLALDYLERGLNLSKQQNIRDYVIKSYSRLHSLEYQRSKYKKAYAYFDSFHTRLTQNLAFNYETASQKEREQYERLLADVKVKDDAIEQLKKRAEEDLKREIEKQELLHRQNVALIQKTHDSLIFVAKTERERELARKDKALALEKEQQESDLRIQQTIADNARRRALDSVSYVNEKAMSKAKAEQEKAEMKIRSEEQLKKREAILYALGIGFVFMVWFAGVFFRQRNKIKKGKQESDKLLLNILPAEIAEELKKKGSADARKYEMVSVLFTDFKDFTQISSRMSPEELVTELNSFFKAFDEITIKHNIEKIKTIGDSYMCVAGLPSPTATHAEDAVRAAIDIQKFVHEHSLKRLADGKEPLEIRIGIHSGPAVAGIVGTRKYAYDIWGDTVNTASRMESSGEAGKVNISGTTHEMVKDKFNFTSRGKIEAKHKGLIEMYFVDGEK